MQRALRAAFAFICVAVTASLCSFAARASTPVDPAGEPDKSVAAVQSNYAKLPLAFERNVGQVDSPVQYLARGPAYSVFLTQSESVLLFERRADQDRARGDREAPLHASAIRMRFEGGNRGATLSGAEQLSHSTNYFLGPDSEQQLTGVPSFGKVRYESVYPGVDLVWHGGQGQLEYDLVLKAKVDPGLIGIRFEGADGVTVSASGDLVLKTGIGDISYLKPVAYQEKDGVRTEVAAAYRVSRDGLVGFDVGSYEKDRPLVIDPILSYSSYLWGDAKSIAVDASGNAYVTGSTTATNLPASTGYQKTFTGNLAAYVVKLNAAGTGVVYATYLGARKATVAGKAITVDTAGNAYVAGSTDSSAYPVTSGAYQTSFSPGASFLTKLNPSGSALVYSTFINGAAVSSITLDAARNVYIVGAASPTTPFVTTPGAFQGGGTGGVVAKLNATGNAMSYAFKFGGSGPCNGIAVDSAGSAYVTGTATAADLPTLNAWQSTLRGTRDAFLAKFNPAGSALVFSTYLGGSDADYGNAVAVSASGEPFVVGRTHSLDYPVSFNAFQTSLGFPDSAVSNAFVTKFSANGSGLLYSTYLGGAWCIAPGVFQCFDFVSEGIDGATAVAVDATGHAYVGGYTDSISFPTLDPIQGPRVGGDDGRMPFLAKIKPDGTRLAWSVLLGDSTGEQRVTGVAVDANGAVYASATIASTFPTTPGMPLTSTGAGAIIKMGPGKYPTLLQVSGSPALANQTVVLTADIQSPTPGGTVSFYDGQTLLATVPVTQGSAAFASTFPLGIHKLTAVNSIDGKVSPPAYLIILSP